MERMIFVNLPVEDLALSKSFYEAVGATNDAQFTDESAAMMRFSPSICVMLLTKKRFSNFTKREIPDAHRVAQVLLAISVDSRDGVDPLIARAVGAGGTADPNPPQDYGFMYSRSFADPDGHIWEPAWMDMSAIPQPA